MKRLFCFPLAVVYLAAAAWCVNISYRSYVSPLPEGFTVYAPFQRRIFDLRYDEIKEIRLSYQPKKNSKTTKTVFSARENPAELKEQVDSLNEYRYTDVKPTRNFIAESIPGEWYEHVGIYVAKWTGEELYCYATKKYIRIGKFPESGKRADLFWRFRGTICYYGDTSPLFEAICS